ncbi:MAG TPA: tetratricopeptide repeat protein [Isosphaeraceae bacterium]|jgi:Flp pilus assembly protein TadD|nr:tetratricopeptide repeat protein [Isosphaeraceae bacterium]
MSDQSEKPSGGASVWNRAAVGVGLALIVVTFIAFWPVVGNGFIENWDDDQNFLENYGFRGLGLDQLGWAWNSTVLGVYQPMAWLLGSIEYAIWGLNPAGFHFSSVVLHAANVVVLYALTLSLLSRCLPETAPGDRWSRPLGAGLAVALFAAHPLRVEVVAWASCQPYLPCALFCMLSVMAYLHAHSPGEPPHEGWLNVSVALFIAALLCKAVAVSLPVVLLILDVYPLRRLGGGPGRWFGREARAVWWEKARFAVTSVLFMAVAVGARERAGYSVTLPRVGLMSRLLQPCYAIGFYLIKTILPLDLTAIYPIPGRDRALDTLTLTRPLFIVSTLAAIGVTVALILVRRRWPGLLAAWACYLVILAPNVGLVNAGLQVTADRYSYVSLMALFVALAAGFSLACERWRTRRAAAASLTAAGLLAMLMLMTFTWRQCRIWHDSRTLWTHALDHGGQACVEIQLNLGASLIKQGDLAEAASHFAEAARLNPASREAHNNLGAVLIEQKRFEEAVVEVSEALRIDPRHPGSHNNMGAALAGLGRHDEAIVHYAEAVRLQPDYFAGHVNLATALARQGKLAEATSHYTEALRLRPDSELVRQALAAVEAKQK